MGQHFKYLKNAQFPVDGKTEEEIGKLLSSFYEKYLMEFEDANLVSSTGAVSKRDPSDQLVCMVYLGFFSENSQLHLLMHSFYLFF